MECYCTCIIDIQRYFFILQSLTTSKMRKFQALKLSQFHKAKTCWTENLWSSGIMRNFFGEFFYVLGVKFFFEFFKFFCPSTSFQSSKFLLCETETVLKSEFFSSLKLSNFARWKNILESLWCRYNSIPLCGTQLSILKT